MRFAAALLVVVLGPGQTARAPVVVELFTSEGCSSCPPADLLLMRLDQEQPVAGGEVVALGLHVDYWDRLGWRDPYSSGEWTLRQQRYSRAFGNDQVYTPQMVVDGRTGFVGSDARRAQAAIAEAAQAPKAAVRISPGAASGVLQVEAEGPAGARDTVEVLLAITEKNLATSVARGENAGRHLRHTSVVRRLRSLGALKTGQKAFSTETRLDPDPRWKRQDLRAVVFLQERRSRRIVGAAAVTFPAG